MFSLPAKKEYFSEVLHKKSPLTLHICTALDFGGIESHLKIISRYATNTVYEHHFCAIGCGGHTEKEMLANGASVYCLEAPVTIPNWRAIWRTYSLIRSLRPDIIHTHGAEANFYGLVAGAIARVRVKIGEEVGMPRHSLRARFVFRQVYRLANIVIGVSDAVTSYLIESKEVTENRTYRLYNPVEILPESQIPRSTSSNDYLRLCHVGRLHPVKNLPFLLDAIACVNSKGKQCELWLVGDGPERDILQNRVKKLQLEQSVHFLGFQRHPENFLSECDLFVQIGRGEGFSLALVEAMRMGLPSITTTAGGGSEVIESGINGWVASPDELDSLISILETALSMSKYELETMGKFAKRTVTGKFTPEIYLNQLDALYNKLLNKTPRKPDIATSSRTQSQ